MAKIGTTPAANRFSGIGVGPDVDFQYEIQDNLPVDGTNEANRHYSPFTIRILPPDILVDTATALEAIRSSSANTIELDNNGFAGEFGALADAATASSAASVGLISAASRGADTFASASSVTRALEQVTVIDTDSSVLRQVIAEGQFRSDSSSDYYSTIVGSATAADIGLQLQQIVNAPPLTLLVNPNSMDISFTKLQSYNSRTRFGYIFEPWGMEQPKISFSMSTGGFYAGAASRGQLDTFLGDSDVRSGLMWASKRDSAAWQNFLAIYTFYRNNGYIFDVLGGSEAHQFIGSLAISYDQWTYVGHLESFNYSYEEQMPHRVEFDMEFTVSRMFDNAESPSNVLPLTAPTASLSDPRYSNRRPTRANTSSGQVASRVSISTPSEEDLAQIPVDLLGNFTLGG